VAWSPEDVADPVDKLLHARPSRSTWFRDPALCTKTVRVEVITLKLDCQAFRKKIGEILTNDP
jgi:hypothetical protein